MVEFHEILAAFLAEQSQPTLLQWERFAATTYLIARKLGFDEGLRYRDAKDGLLTPEQVADMDDPNWRNSPAENLSAIGALAVDAMILGDARDEAG
jgi:hypothetical protein